MATNDATFEDAVKAWLAEEPKYMGQKIGEGNLADWGHYSKWWPSDVRSSLLTPFSSAMSMAWQHASWNGKGEDQGWNHLHCGPIYTPGQYHRRQAVLMAERCGEAMVG